MCSISIFVTYIVVVAGEEEDDGGCCLLVGDGDQGYHRRATSNDDNITIDGAPSHGGYKDNSLQGQNDYSSLLPPVITANKRRGTIDKKRHPIIIHIENSNQQTKVTLAFGSHRIINIPALQDNT